MKNKIPFGFQAAATILFGILFFYAVPSMGQEAQLKVIAPNGNEKYVIGSMVEIQWSAKNYLGTIDILLKKNDFIIGEIATNLNVSAGKFSWKAGMVKIGLAGLGDTYKILIRANGAKSEDESDNFFSILTSIAAGSNTAPIHDPARLAVTKPDAGSRWCLDTRNVIQWTGSLSPVVTFKIELLPASGPGTKVIGSSVTNNGSFPWKINLAQYHLAEGIFKIRISTMDGGLTAESPPFRIGKDLTLLTPRFNQIWRKGSNYQIEWLNDCAIPQHTVRIELANAEKESMLVLAEGAALNKSFSWTVPNHLKAGEYFIRLTTADKSISTETQVIIEDAVQAPSPKPTITVTQPNVGSAWCAGYTHQIQWGSTLPAETKLKIELLSDESASKMFLTRNAPNSGTYDFKIDPRQHDFIHRLFRLRVGTADDAVFYETQNFIIGKPVSITSPKNTDTWHKGRSYPISWGQGCESAARTVKLELLDQNNNLIMLIASDHPIDQAYQWEIPGAFDAVPGTYKIKVSTMDNRWTTEESFNLSGAL